MTTAQKQDYSVWLKDLRFTHTATIRSIYPLTQNKMDKYINGIISKNKNIDSIYSVIEPDRDPYSKAQDITESYRTTSSSTGNHAHLLIKWKRPQAELIPRHYLNNLPYTIPYYETIDDIDAMTKYIVKHQTPNNYNFFIG